MSTGNTTTNDDSTVRWLTSPDETFHIRTARRLDVQTAHDENFHARIEQDPHLFCDEVVMAQHLEVHKDVVALSWASIPYCQSSERTDGLRSVGWNFVVTVDDGSNVVVVLRSPELRDGNLWHLSPNETVEPKDLLTAHDNGGNVHLGSVAARAIHEELGVTLDASQLNLACTFKGAFAVGLGFGLLIHVAGEHLGITGKQVINSHRNAQDGWEGTPHIVEHSEQALRNLSAQHGWVPWSLPCLMRTLHQR